MLAIGYEELGEPVKKGDLVKCGRCDRLHRLRCAIDGATGKETNLLMFYKCGRTSYLAGVAGRKYK